MTLADPILGGHDGFLSPPHANDIHLVHCEVRATQVQPAEHLQGVAWPTDARTRGDEVVLGAPAGSVAVEDAFPHILEGLVVLLQEVAEVVQFLPCVGVQVDELNEALPLAVQGFPDRLQVVPVARLLTTSEELLKLEPAVPIEVQGLAPSADDVAEVTDKEGQEVGQCLLLIILPPAVSCLRCCCGALQLRRHRGGARQLPAEALLDGQGGPRLRRGAELGVELVERHVPRAVLVQRQPQRL
mmetsp:Transcript_8378/g.23504  ORF Transcript_8378/g.23504 Transcript_8378/m.23504 type:complete len:243 (-) Transcript_8378:342-1070(-)